MKIAARIVLPLLVCFTVGQVQAQRKLIDKYLSNEKDTTRNGRFIVLPGLAYAQETGFEFGLVGMYAFYTSKEDTLTRSSSVSGVATFTTKKQTNLKFQADVWSPQNKYHYLSEIRYKNFPFNFYGVGGATHAIDKDVLVQQLMRLYGEVEKEITSHYYIGISTDYQHYQYTDKVAGGIYDVPNPSFTGRDGGDVWYWGLSQIIDTRNTNTYTTKGTYVKLNYSYAPGFFGGDTFTGSCIKLDFRTFAQLKPKLVLGINVNYQTLQGSDAPFYLMPQLGNDQMMRGYYTGRYRDKNLMAAQAELRYRFYSRLGVVAFAGAGNVYGIQKFDIGRFKPSYGAGLRYFFDINRDLSVRFDYGIGEQRPGEKRQTGFYFSIAEAF